LTGNTADSAYSIDDGNDFDKTTDIAAGAAGALVAAGAGA